MAAIYAAPPPQDVTLELEVCEIEWQETLGPDYRLADFGCGRYVAGIVYEIVLRAAVMDYILEQDKDVACAALHAWPFDDGAHRFSMRE